MAVVQAVVIICSDITMMLEGNLIITKEPDKSELLVALIGIC